MTLFIDTFPVLEVFGNLHMVESLQIAKKALYGLSGIYGVVHIPTGTSYIGSSFDLGGRIMDHIQNNSSNLHLQSAIVKYGLSHFAFVILENCIPSDLLKREQHFLDILFSLPANLRYNFARFAEASFKGLTHTPESKALISTSMTGNSHSDDTRAKMSEAHKGLKSGENNPMYGKSGELSPVSIQVYVYSINNVLIGTFSSQVACAKWLGVSSITVSRYIRSGKNFQGKYLLTSFPI